MTFKAPLLMCPTDSIRIETVSIINYHNLIQFQKSSC